MERRVCDRCGAEITVSDDGKVNIQAREWYICRDCAEWIKEVTKK